MRLLLGGKLGRHPHLADQVLETDDPDKVLDYLDRIVGQYLQESEKDQRFAAWVGAAWGPDNIVRPTRGINR